MLFSRGEEQTLVVSEMEAKISESRLHEIQKCFSIENIKTRDGGSWDAFESA
jgi:hypothetical protein